jgi:hypothetical protein
MALCYNFTRALNISSASLRAWQANSVALPRSWSRFAHPAPAGDVLPKYGFLALDQTLRPRHRHMISTRSSLRPRFEGSANDLKASDKPCRENAASHPIVIARRLSSTRSGRPGDPVFQSANDGMEKLRRTGYSAGACHRDRRRRDPVAEYDDLEWSSAFVSAAPGVMGPGSEAGTTTRPISRGPDRICSNTLRHHRNAKPGYK